MTRDLVFHGPEVLHIREAECATWQVDYAILDRYNKGYVFVPRTPTIVCKLFRINHEDEDGSPTHRLVHASRDMHPTLCCLWEVGMDEELTFDYFGRGD